MTPKTKRHFLVVGEKKIFQEILEIVNTASKANKVMTFMATGDYTSKSLDESIRTIASLEKKSDEIAFRAGEDITSGAVSPNILDELLESVQHADNIVDLHHNLSRELGRMSYASFEKSSSTDNEWNTVFASMVALAGKAISKLEKMLSTADLAEILNMRKEIEALEEQGDEIKDEGFDKLYAAAHKLNYLQFFHYSEVLHMCDDILDECEDLSDAVVSVVTSILK